MSNLGQTRFLAEGDIYLAYVNVVNQLSREKAARQA